MQSVAHVGFTGTPGDHDRINMVVGWLVEHNQTALWPREPERHDRIELRQGRDFLMECAQYDVVVLHNLYWPTNSHGLCGIFTTSPAHSPESWRTRLVQTCASVVFLFGDWTEVSPDNIGKLVGYTLHQPSYGFSIFTRNKERI
jgi:hypothetical protein